MLEKKHLNSTVMGKKGETAKVSSHFTSVTVPFLLAMTVLVD